MPYGFALNRERLVNAPLSMRQMLLVSVLQTSVLVAIAAGAGLLLSHAIGLGAPLLERALAGGDVWPMLASQIPLALGLGAAAAIVVLALEVIFFRPRVPPALHRQPSDVAIWKRVLAGFYGGIVEEVLMRLFVFSLLAWLLGHIWQTPDQLPTDAAFWAANVGAALVFGIGHLPATASLVPLTRLVVVRALVLNGIAGIAFGYLYWQHSLIAAMLAHFTADMVILVFAPPFIKSEEGQPEMSAAQ